MWQTIAVCKSSLVSVPESICYLYGEDGRKRDLSSLVKLSGAYAVMTDDDSDMYINVCRDISLRKLSHSVSTTTWLCSG